METVHLFAIKINQRKLLLQRLVYMTLKWTLVEVSTEVAAIINVSIEIETKSTEKAISLLPNFMK